MLIVPISEREFNLYALSLPAGPNFGPVIYRSGWKSQDGRSAGALFFDPNRQKFEIVVLRRRTDHCFVPTCSKMGWRAMTPLWLNSPQRCGLARVRSRCRQAQKNGARYWEPWVKGWMST